MRFGYVHRPLTLIAIDIEGQTLMLARLDLGVATTSRCDGRSRRRLVLRRGHST